ncbi:sortase B protein-sorting domain-containing protein [Cognatishimia sp. SS12]|nr:sortase B protein-sorting domain-containing protein [Cognatishimia sp. SS12]
MVVLVAMPAMILPGVSSDSAQIALLISLFAAALVFIEYFATYPSIIEFRYAPPFNRLRYASVFLTVFVLASIARNGTDPSLWTGLLTSLGQLVGAALDFPYSPVRLVLATLPAGTDLAEISFVRAAAGLSYALSLLSLLLFYFMVRVLEWPARNGAFNVWVNLPLFDPTAGGDVLPRLNRDGRLNIALGFLLPFLFPAFIHTISDLFNTLQLTHPQTLIWTVILWAFFPAGLVMRGVAMIRIAAMIDENRKRAYAVAQGLQPV